MTTEWESQVARETPHLTAAARRYLAHRDRERITTGDRHPSLAHSAAAQHL